MFRAKGLEPLLLGLGFTLLGLGFGTIVCQFRFMFLGFFFH